MHTIHWHHAVDFPDYGNILNGIFYHFLKIIIIVEAALTAGKHDESGILVISVTGAK